MWNYNEGSQANTTLFSLLASEHDMPPSLGESQNPAAVISRIRAQWLIRTGDHIRVGCRMQTEAWHCWHAHHTFKHCQKESIWRKIAWAWREEHLLAEGETYHSTLPTASIEEGGCEKQQGETEASVHAQCPLRCAKPMPPPPQVSFCHFSITHYDTNTTSPPPY